MSRPVQSDSQTTHSRAVADRRQRIIETTRGLIGEVGIEAITMRYLARRCGVAVATLYNQFGSREAIIAQALREDFEGRYQPFPEHMLPSERLEARIRESAAAITGSLRDYTRSVMFFYFHYRPDPDLRGTIHDFVVQDFTAIARMVESRGELQPWVNLPQFTDDLVTQLYSIATKWTQGYISDRYLRPRLMLAASASFAGVSLGESRREFEALAMRHSTRRAQKR